MRCDQKVLKSLFWLRFSLDRFQRSCYFQICQWNFCYALCWMLEELQCFLCARYLRLHIKACKLHSSAENCCWPFPYWISPQDWASVEHHLRLLHRKPLSPWLPRVSQALLGPTIHFLFRAFVSAPGFLGWDRPPLQMTADCQFVYTFIYKKNQPHLLWPPELVVKLHDFLRGFFLSSSLPLLLQIKLS